MLFRPGIALLACAAAAGCGDRGTGDDHDAPVESVSLLASAPGDESVAEIDGRPILASCVEAQAEAHGAGANEALDACIGFELLAQAAEERGYTAHPEVLDARRRQLVRAFINDVFAAEFAGPDDVPRADLEEIWPRVKGRFDHPELRFAAYVRAPVPDDAEPGSEPDRAARVLAEEVYETLSAYTNLDEDRFPVLAAEVAGDREIQQGEPFTFSRHGRAEEAFAEAAFAIPEVGMLAEPTRTKGGWDVILLTRIEPETHQGFDEASPELREVIFEASRQRGFLRWVDGFAQTLGVEAHPEHLDSLAEPSGPLGAGP